MTNQLNLHELRAQLIRQEETIIFALIERAQFKLNADCYEPNAIPVAGFDGCFSDYLLWETEKIHARVRRYTSPDEHPFFANLPAPILPVMDYPHSIKPITINFNNRILALYRQSILPAICEAGDDHHYGSSATCDVVCLQALSKRIHYGKFVAEAKYQEQPGEYNPLIEAGDGNALLMLLTDREVEKKLLQRVAIKAATYGQDIDHATEPQTPTRYKIMPEVIVAIYDRWILPLTKEVEVAYLLRRLDGN